MTIGVVEPFIVIYVCTLSKNINDTFGLQADYLSIDYGNTDYNT